MGLGSGVGNASGLRTSNPQLVGLWFGPEGDRDSEEGKIRWGVVRMGLSPVQCSVWGPGAEILSSMHRGCSCDKKGLALPSHSLHAGESFGVRAEQPSVVSPAGQGT